MQICYLSLHPNFSKHTVQHFLITGQKGLTGARLDADLKVGGVTQLALVGER